MGKRPTRKSIRVFEGNYEKPVNKILSSVAKIEATNSDPALINYLQKMRGSSLQIVRASKMIGDITRLTNGLYRHNEQCIDIMRFVREIVRAAAPYVLKNGIGICYKLPSERIFAITEIEPLTTILCQLLSNACRFTAPGNRICVTAALYEAEHLAEVTVWDMGAGIPDSIAQHIFDPYFTYDTGGVPFQGNGLGLTLARAFAQFLGGHLEFSHNGRGSYFRLALPLHRRKRPRPSKPPIPKDLVNISMSDTVPVTK